MKILIVEDSKTDREILKYLLESRFQREAKFREASSLETATSYLLRGDIDCVILDLQLPDSVGKETFLKLAKRFPQVPIIVMTNNKDRNLAVEMIQQGAEDFIIKKFTDEEEIFRRVLFAVEKHKRTVRMPPDEVASVRELDLAQAQMLSAHQSGEHQTVQASAVEVARTMVNISRKMFTELQRIRTSISQQATNHEHIVGTVDKLHLELLEGYPNKPSLKSQVEVLNHRVISLEEHFNLERNTQFELTPKSASNRRSFFLLSVMVLLGIVVGLLMSRLF